MADVVMTGLGPACGQCGKPLSLDELSKLVPPAPKPPKPPRRPELNPENKDKWQ